MTEKPRAGSEGAWSEWDDVDGDDDRRSDGGDVELTPLRVLRDDVDADETIRSVVVLEREREEITVLVVREAPAKSGDGEVVHLRTATIDTEDRVTRWHDNGMFLGNSDGLLPGVIKAIAAARDESEEVVASGLPVGDDSLAREIMSEALDPDLPDASGEVVDHSDRSVEGVDGPTVECSDCGAEILREDAENMGGGLVDVWVHSGPCNGGEDA